MKVHISALSLLLMGVASCSSIPDRSAVIPPVSPWTAVSMNQAPVVLDWWTQFGDQQLNDLVETAFVRNADLRAADANLRAAQALLGETRALRLPSGQLTVGIERTRVAGLSQPEIPGTPEKFESQTLAGINGVLTWELDLFGRIAAQIDLADANTEQAIWYRRQVQAGVAAAVVRAWLEYRSSLETEALIQERLSALEQFHDGLAGAVALGGVSRADLDAARVALEQVRAELPLVEARRRNAARRVAVLVGETPTPALTVTRFSPAPETLSAGEPLDMLRRRPDVAAAERRLAAANAGTRIAVADLYPRIGFGSAIGMTAEPDRIGDAGSVGFSVGPQLSWGLFDMDRL